MAATVVLVGSCGKATDPASDAGGGVEALAGKCEAACRPPSAGPCASQDSTRCRKDCVAAAAGLAINCAQCLIEQTQWRDDHCTCYGKGCCVKSSGSGAPSDCSPESSCATADESCKGYFIGKATSSSCTGSCSTGGRDAG